MEKGKHLEALHFWDMDPTIDAELMGDCTPKALILDKLVIDGEV